MSKYTVQITGCKVGFWFEANSKEEAIQQIKDQIEDGSVFTGISSDAFKMQAYRCPKDHERVERVQDQGEE